MRNCYLEIRMSSLYLILCCLQNWKCVFSHAIPCVFGYPCTPSWKTPKKGIYIFNLVMVSLSVEEKIKSTFKDVNGRLYISLLINL